MNKYRISDEATSNEYSAHTLAQAVVAFLRKYDTGEMEAGETFTALVFTGDSLMDVMARITVTADGKGHVLTYMTHRLDTPTVVEAALDSHGVSGPSCVTIIDDGQVRYPVSNGDLAAWQNEHGKIAAAIYEKFCADVDCIGEEVAGTPGSAGMIELCDALVDAGATTLRLG